MSTEHDTHDHGTHDHGTEAQAIIAVTKEAGAGELRDLSIDERYSLLVPDGHTHEIVDLSYLKDRPHRKYGETTLMTVDDFSNYVARHDDPNGTTVWADIDTGKLAAVLNDHEGTDKAGWGDHRAGLALRPTDEWKHWLGKDGQLLDQEVFAEHVEDGQKEILLPDAAELLDIVTTMQGHTTADWRQAIRLQDGAVQFTYNEEATATAGGNGELEIPGTFQLGISPFLGEEPYRLIARLRYRVSGGNLRIGYKLDRPQDVVRDAIDQIATRLAQSFPGRVFVGVPRP